MKNSNNQFLIVMAGLIFAIVKSESLAVDIIASMALMVLLAPNLLIFVISLMSFISWRKQENALLAQVRLLRITRSHFFSLFVHPGATASVWTVSLFMNYSQEQIQEAKSKF